MTAKIFCVDDMIMMTVTMKMMMIRMKMMMISGAAGKLSGTSVMPATD